MPPRLLTPTMILMLESTIGWAGLTPQPLTVHEFSPDEWPLQHQQWDAREQAARELYRVEQPDLNQMTAMLALERVSIQILCSRNDRAMVERLMPYLGHTTPEGAIRHAETFLKFLTAVRPPKAA